MVSINILKRLKVSIDQPTENWTKFPNNILDNLHEFTPVATQIICLIIRKNIGYQNPNKQFSSGYVAKKLNMSRTTAKRGIHELTDKGAIYKTGVGIRGVNQYQINWTRSEFDQVNNCPSTRSKNGHDHGQKLTTVKENKVQDNIKIKQVIEVLDHFNKESGMNQSLNKSLERNIVATVNKYSVDKLKSAITQMCLDRWTIERNAYSLNRLVKPDKRDANMRKFGGFLQRPPEDPIYLSESEIAEIEAEVGF